jgi:hypothetical protein
MTERFLCLGLGGVSEIRITVFFFGVVEDDEKTRCITFSGDCGRIGVSYYRYSK